MLIVGFSQAATSELSQGVKELQEVGKALMSAPSSQKHLYVYESISRLNNVDEKGRTATVTETNIIAQALIHNATVPDYNIEAASLARFYIPKSFKDMSPIQQATRRAYLAISLLALNYKKLKNLPIEFGNQEARDIIETATGPIRVSNYYGSFDAFLESRFGERKEEGKSFKEDLQQDFIKLYDLFQKNFKAVGTWEELKEEKEEPFPTSSINPLLVTYQKVLYGLMGSLTRSPELHPANNITKLDLVAQRKTAAYLLEKQAFFLGSMGSEAYLATVKSYGLSSSIAYDLSALAYFSWTNPTIFNERIVAYMDDEVLRKGGKFEIPKMEWQEVFAHFSRILALQERSELKGKLLPLEQNEFQALFSYTLEQANAIKDDLSDSSDQLASNQEHIVNFAVNFVRRVKIIEHLRKKYDINGITTADLELIQQALDLVYSKSKGVAEVEAKPTVLPIKQGF